MQLGGHVGDHMVDRLEHGDRLAELLARAGIVDREVQCQAGQPQQGGAMQQAVEGDTPHRQLETLPLLTNAIGHAAPERHQA